MKIMIFNGSPKRKKRYHALKQTFRADDTARGVCGHRE